MEMMKAALSLCFMALSKVELKNIQTVYDAIEVTLKEWIADRSVMGGSVFGGSVGYYWNPDEERKVRCILGGIVLIKIYFLFSFGSLSWKWNVWKVQ